MVTLDSPLDLDDPAAEEFLDGVQGNIIKGHGRDHAAHLVLGRAGGADAARAWLAAFAAERVTTAAAARRQARSWGPGDPGEPFAMVLLAPAGYRYLGVADADIPGAAQQYFPFGMQRQSELQPSYSDPEPATWEPAYRQPIDAMVILADDDRDRLERCVAEVTASAEGVFEVRVVECGTKLRGTFEHGSGDIEHFGYRDGISQPLMVAQDIQEEVDARGDDHWNPGAPLSLALVAEDASASTYGSFMVFRKLEQDVAAFRRKLDAEARVSGVAAETLGAMAVGRHRNGEPLVPTGVKSAGADANDFAYDQDVNGGQCPFHAHIRKTNPRGDLSRRPVGPLPLETERRFRIVRRGITYGERPDLDGHGDPPSEGVGLLFMCFQSNLVQFAIQQEGSDGNAFAFDDVGVDPLIGHNSAPTPQTWPSTGTLRFTLDDVVRMRGGEYFFAPSMTFLRGLA
jgi:Dyp-type peroxidase family